VRQSFAQVLPVAAGPGRPGPEQGVVPALGAPVVAGEVAAVVAEVGRGGEHGEPALGGLLERPRHPVEVRVDRIAELVRRPEGYEPVDRGGCRRPEQGLDHVDDDRVVAERGPVVQELLDLVRPQAHDHRPGGLTGQQDGVTLGVLEVRPTTDGTAGPQREIRHRAEFTNGFHDTANAMATSIATKALRPKVAVTLSGTLNLIGAFLPVQVALTVTNAVVKIQNSNGTPKAALLAGGGADLLLIVLAGLIGGIVWTC
jgi:hypothetical protein